MAELFLKFTDENGEETEVPVEQEEFIIGRHSENDLSVVNSNLSRKHIKIQRFADVFIVSDLDSSNGTKLNGEDLSEPASLRNGDSLDLGGGLTLEVILDDPNAIDSKSDEEESENESSNANNSSNVKASANSAGTSVSSQKSGGSGFGKALIIAPILGVLLLFFVIGGILLIGGNSGKELAQENNDNDDGFISSSTPDINDEPNNDNETAVETNVTPQTELPDNTEATNTPAPNNSSVIPVENETPEPQTETTNTPAETDETSKIRSNSFQFMRKIGTSNQKPVLLSGQIAQVQSRINTFKGSRALANNIRNAKNNASEIQTLARSKNLPPQLLVTAALTKLGNSSGDVLSKAREMAGVLDNLSIQIGSEQPDDSLILIAAYDQGERGDFLRMRNTLQGLAAKFPNTRSSEVRTIWFLKDQGKINSSQFELALRFLAIGTITQNPKAFNVNAEALNLN